MGCVSSKKARKYASSPDAILFTSTTTTRDHNNNVVVLPGNSDSNKVGHVNKGGGGFGGGTLEKIKEEPEKERNEESARRNRGISELRHSKSLKKGESSGRRSAFSLKIGRLTQGEHVAAGWPAWLSAVAGEAVEGWLPLRSDTFERLEKPIAEQRKIVRNMTSSFLKNKYWVLRHGKSIPNEKGIIVSSVENGTLDEYKLASEGVKQAQLAGELFLKELKEKNILLENVRICYSPFSRTRHTAEVVASILSLPFEGPQCKHTCVHVRGSKLPNCRSEFMAAGRRVGH